MAFFRLIHKVIKNPNSYSSSSYYSLTPILSPPPLAAAAAFSPFTGASAPFLFLPHWNFSHSATTHIAGNNVALLNRALFERSKLGGLRFFSKVNDTEVDTTRRETKNDEGGVGSGGGGIGCGGGGFVESFVNWPNFISFSRMLSGPVLGWVIVNEWYLPAFVGLAVSGATDWLDGYLARRMGIDSVVGSYLDPLADKVLIGCVAVAMVENNLLHPGLVGLVVLRDVMLVGGAVYKRGSSLNWQWKSWYDFFNLDGTHPEKVEPLFISKVNTVLQLILVAGALLQPELGTSETQAYITYLSWLVASTTVGSTAAYGVQHIRSRSLSVTRGH